jgi:hypothetical protein
MRSPQIVGLVERRLLVNYRVEREFVTRILPSPLRPQLVRGWAVAGICLIRLGRLRPRYVPGPVGLRSENAAHRIAVEWDTPGGQANGVYIPRRDSASLVNVTLGGRLFPGEHHRARFEVHETMGDLHIAFASIDQTTRVNVHARTTHDWTSGLFTDLDKASAFFRQGAAGYSATGDGYCLDGLELQTSAWKVEPAAVVAASSSFFDDPARFPTGSVTLDGALLMRNVPVAWVPLAPMQVGINAELAARELGQPGRSQRPES